MVYLNILMGIVIFKERLRTEINCGSTVGLLIKDNSQNQTKAAKAQTTLYVSVAEPEPLMLPYIRIFRPNH